MMKKSALKVVSSNKTPYDKTRHNAMRHGVLSYVAVLPWEKQEDLEHLKQRFFDDFNPQGAIEIYLVEELATLAFRKQRLYKAEDALIAKKLDQLESCFGKNPFYTSANLMSPSANVEGSYLHSIPMKSILYPDQKNDEESIVECRTKIRQYQALLNKNDLTYETLLNFLPETLKNHWLRIVRDNSNIPDIETLKSLQDYLADDVIKPLDEKINTLEGKDCLRQQAVGMAYLPDDKAHSLQRYEVTMDRLFERKLAALVKLQEIRGNKPITIEA